MVTTTPSSRLEVIKSACDLTFETASAIKSTISNPVGEASEDWAI